MDYIHLKVFIGTVKLNIQPDQTLVAKFLKHVIIL